MSIQNGNSPLADTAFSSYAACMESPSSNPFSTLQTNSEALFDQIFNRNKSQMACKSGCSSCCETEFSVFRGEALLIWEWFQNLNESEKGHLKLHWSSPQPPTSPKKSCAFLVQGKCTIYKARPIICRTQGAPLCVSDEIKKTKELNCCPLNFDQGKQIPKNAGDWFDLNRLTELQSIAENYVKKNLTLPKELSDLIDESGRIALKSLRSALVSS